MKGFSWQPWGCLKPPTSIPVFFGPCPENEPSYSPLHPGALRSYHRNPLCRVPKAFQKPPLPHPSLNSLALGTACCIINKAPSSTTFFTCFSQSKESGCCQRKALGRCSLCASKVGQGPSTVFTGCSQSHRFPTLWNKLYQLGCFWQ